MDHTGGEGGEKAGNGITEEEGGYYLSFDRGPLRKRRTR